jgi:hypothetical protein
LKINQTSKDLKEDPVSSSAKVLGQLGQAPALAGARKAEPGGERSDKGNKEIGFGT